MKGTQPIMVHGIEFNPSKDRVFFDFDGVLHTSTHAVRRDNGFIENHAAHYAEYWKLEPNQHMIDFIHTLSVHHGIDCYLLTANDYRIAQLFIRHHAPQLKNAFRNMFSSLSDKADFLRVMRASHFFDDSDSVMYDIITKWDGTALPKLFYVEGNHFDDLESCLEALPWDRRKEQASKLEVDSSPRAEAHVVDTVLSTLTGTISQVISTSKFTVAAPLDEQSTGNPDGARIAKSLFCKGPFVGAYGLFFGTCYDGEQYRHLKWPAIYRDTAFVANLTDQHLFLTVPIDESASSFVTYLGNPYAISAAHFEAIKSDPCLDPVDNDQFPMLDIEKVVLEAV